MFCLEILKTGQAVNSKIAYSTDTWTTQQMVYTFACTIGSFVNEDWELIERVVDFKVLEDKEITNAGFGSNLSIDGTVECDATVVDHLGRSGACGAVPSTSFSLHSPPARWD